MTIERAIEILDANYEELFESIKLLFALLNEDTEEIEKQSLELLESMRMGMEALKKQQPMKPKEFAFTRGIEICHIIHHENVALYKCGYCNAAIPRHSKYCRKCGQALDWGDKQ